MVLNPSLNLENPHLQTHTKQACYMMVTCIYHLYTGEMGDRRSLELPGQPGQISELWVWQENLS